MSTAIQKIRKAVWATDFSAFFSSLVRWAMHVRHADTGYVPPMAVEDSLCYCLFNKYLPYRKEIDERVRAIRTLDPATYVREVIDFCYQLTPNRAAMSPDEQSVALLVLYRCLFSRAYELDPEFFRCEPNSSHAQSLARLREVSASRVLLPWNLLGTSDRSQSIFNLFRSDRNFSDGSDLLFCALFQCTPVDTLACVKDALSAIHRAALKNLHLASPEEVNPSSILPFDDFFMLFFGALVASDLPSPGYIGWLASKYLLKSTLAPAFEYVQANLEGMLYHCNHLDIEALASRDSQN
jgi:hypothetical protein